MDFIHLDRQNPMTYPPRYDKSITSPLLDRRERVAVHAANFTRQRP